MKAVRPHQPDLLSNQRIDRNVRTTGDTDLNDGAARTNDRERLLKNGTDPGALENHVKIPLVGGIVGHQAIRFVSGIDDLVRPHRQSSLQWRLGDIHGNDLLSARDTNSANEQGSDWAGARHQHPLAE